MKRIHRVYFDKIDYVKPKEVIKCFNLLKLINNLDKQLDVAFKRSTKDNLETELAEHRADLQLTMNVITPKDGTWRIFHSYVTPREHAESFAVMEIYTEVVDSIFEKGQDDE
jgi:hypothetical protein